jgi:hypothetical protein
MPKPVSPAQRDALYKALETRFQKTIRFHPDLSWESVRAKLEADPDKLMALYAMETTGGEPNVVPDPEHPSATVFMDCSAESPPGRRSLCYDEVGRLSRKLNAPEDSAGRMAADMGIALLSEAQYRALQELFDFDLKTSNWVRTPEGVRKLGGALFCDKRYGRTFTYHNGADSYYQSRGFRGYIVL